jgi:cytochrome bd-type quinol oxidase subunit 2
MSVVIDVYAITIFPFIISREWMNEATLNHETIHIYQQRELLVIPFYILYFYYYLVGIIKYKDKQQA